MNTLTEGHTPAVGARTSEQAAGRRGWSWPYLLAAWAPLWLFWMGWTELAWLADGPHSITQFRGHGRTLNWYAARGLEALVVVTSVAVIVYVVRDCRRQRRILTFEVLFMVAGATTIWNGMGMNVINPIFSVSSTVVNLNNPLGHMPLVPNPDAGRAPDPIFNWFVCAFCYLGMAIVVRKCIPWARRRWPGISNANLVGLLIVFGIVLDIAIEIPAIALGLWSWATPDWLSLPLGGGLRYFLLEPFAAGTFFGLVAALYAVRDDHGHTFTERGLERDTPRVRKGVTFLALVTSFQLLTWGPGTPLWYFPFAEWHKVPNYLVNGLCDAPGHSGTRYGPCPGSPSYRMPGRDTRLHGRSP